MLWRCGDGLAMRGAVEKIKCPKENTDICAVQSHAPQLEFGNVGQNVLIMVIMWVFFQSKSWSGVAFCWRGDLAQPRQSHAGELGWVGC